jgi:hypothetical protein
MTKGFSAESFLWFDPFSAQFAGEKPLQRQIVFVGTLLVLVGV